MKNLKLILVLAFIIAQIFAANQVFASTEVVKFLIDLGTSYYNEGRYDQALSEFKKALVLEPENATAAEYIATIEKAEAEIALLETEQIEAKQAEPPAPEQIQEAVAPEINEPVPPPMTQPEIEPAAAEPEFKPHIPSKSEMPATVQSISGTSAPVPAKPAADKKDDGKHLQIGKVIVSGEVQMAAGIDSGGNGIWNRANFDLNEKNWRILSSTVYNYRENTYDPGIYDRLKVIMETPEEDNGFGFHTNITIDPWSFTRKSEKTTITGAGGDSAEVQLKGFGNGNYMLNSSVYTLQNNDTFNIPEIKVVNGTSVPANITSTWTNTFAIPALDVDYEFQPIRELWVDYKQDDYLKLRVFPIATEKQAYTSDDPLRLSNNRTYWEDSPWIRSWKKGNFNSGTSQSFTKGYWDDSISFGARDSSGNRLTALRGFSFDLNPADGTSFTTNWASPKDPWQYYSEIDNIGGATRIKQVVGDKVALGLTHTARVGLVDDGSTVDSRVNVLAGDASYEFIEGTKAVAEAAASQGKYDITNSTYRTRSRGNAYFFSLVNRYPQQEILTTNFDYIQPEKDESFMSKVRFMGVHMDKGFDAPLSSYRQTRKDSYWSRHIHFRQPLDYFYESLFYPTMSSSDLSAFAIGDGVDIGRDVIGMRWKVSLEDRFNNLFDIRNVHNVNGKYIETVARDEAELKVTDKLTAKALGIYQDMPKTKGGIDPFIYDSLTGEYLTNSAVKDGEDPSLKTGSLGMEYAFTEWMKVNGVYERTNDYTLAYGDFPRGILSSSNMSDTYYEYGNKYMRELNYLYSQQYFPSAPYSFYNVYKAGIMLTPTDKIQLYLDYTRNDFKKAGQISDGMNHYGAEIGYLPTKKLGFYTRYTYSIWQDLDRVIEGGDNKTIGHHNIFITTRYSPTKDQEFDIEYGVSPNYPVIESTTSDPLGGSLQTIDTVHIIRLYYRRKF
jgi:hypothetical protein